MTKFQITGLSNHKYIDSRNKEEYKNGDTVFALCDMDNNTIILATKYITDDSKLEKYVYEINKSVVIQITEDLLVV
jgi:hypothetical protein